MSERRERRFPIVGPVILIGLGILALMHNYGLLPANFWQTAWRLWPLILILIGVEIVIGQLPLPSWLNFILALLIVAVSIAGIVYLAGQTPEEEVSSGDMRRLEQALNGATAATVHIGFGAGSLRVGSVSSNHIMVGDFLVARGEPQVRVAYSVSGGRGALRLDVPSNQVVPILTTGRGNQWDVKLNSTIPLDLRIDSGASTNDLDLTDLKLVQLRIEAGVSTNTVRLPKTGNYTARITGGLATTTIYIPEGVAARIAVEGGLSTVSIDTVRFPKTGDEYVSPNFATATNKVDLIIEGGLATVTVK